MSLRDEFGLSQEQFEEISSNREKWSDVWIQQAIEFTRDRIDKGKVKSPSLFLMKAIRDGLRISESERKIAAQNSARVDLDQQSLDLKDRQAKMKEEKDREHAETVSKTILAALATFDKMNEKERTQIIIAFARSAAGKTAAMRCKVSTDDITEPLIRGNQILSKALGAYIATQRR